MTFPKTLIAASLALACCSGFAATAALDLSSGSAGFVSTPPAGGFSDTFTFTLGVAATLTGIVDSVVNGGQNVDFGSITLTGPSGLFSFAKLSSDPFEIWTLPATSLLAPGSYSLTLLGVNSAAIGTYSGNIALSAAVPEPETYMLLMAGIGIVGATVLRKRKLDAN